MSIKPLTTVLLLLAIPILAQDRTDSLRMNPASLLPLNPSLYGVTQWRVGESAEYKLTTYKGGLKEVKRVRYAVLGEQHIGPSTVYVVENQVTDFDEARRTTINSVVRPFGDLTNLLDGASGDFITKQDTSPAISIPVQLLRDRLMPFQRTASAPRITSMETMGEESIETLAGKFKTTHQRLYFNDGRAAEVWWTRSLGPLGLVRVVSREMSLTLISHQSKKSVSAIIEIPKPLVDR